MPVIICLAYFCCDVDLCFNSINCRAQSRSEFEKDVRIKPTITLLVIYFGIYSMESTSLRSIWNNSGELYTQSILLMAYSSSNFGEFISGVDLVQNLLL